MPIDPSILQGIKLPQFQDPMEQYSNALMIQNVQNQLAEYDRQLSERNALNKFITLNPDGTIDYPTTMRKMATGGYGSRAADMQKSWIETQKAQGELRKLGLETQKLQGDVDEIPLRKRKLQGELTDADIKRAKDAIGMLRTKNDVINWINVNNEVLKQQGQDLSPMIPMIQRMPDADFQQFLLNMQLGPEKASETESFTMDSGKHVTRYRVPTHGKGKPEQIVRETVERSPNAPETKIIMPGEKTRSAFEDTFGKEGAERVYQLEDNAQSAVTSAARAKDMLNLLESNQELITGFAANQRLALAQFGKLAFGIKDASIEKTIELSANLAKNTLESFKLLGLTGKQMDTPNERDFLEKAATGNVTFDRDALILLMKLQHRAAENIVARRNAKVKLVPDEVARNAAFDKTPIVIQPYKSIVDIPTQADIDYLHANKSNPKIHARFDARFGKGKAAEFLKSKPEPINVRGPR